MKKINNYISFCFVLFLTVFACKLNTDKTKKESINIITLLYNNELANFHAPPPPPPKDIPIDEIKPLSKPELKKYDSDKIILEGKFAIVIENDESIKKFDLEIFPIEFQEIFSNSKHIMSKDSLIKLNLLDSFNKKIPIVNKQGIKIQDLVENHKVFGVIFISEIKFNEEFNKALLVFGRYSHELAGSASIIGLEKIKGKWVLKYGQILSES